MIRNAWHFEPILKAMIENRNKYVSDKTFVSGLADSINLGEISKTAERLYKIVLVKHSPSEQELLRLKQLDEYLKENCTSAYDYLGTLRLKNLPVHYIRFWRKSGRRFPVDWMRDTYRKVLYGNRE